MKKQVLFAVVLAFAFFATSLVVQTTKHKTALVQKPTLNRLVKAPLLTLSKYFENSSCSIRQAKADLEGYTAANGFENPGDCGCDSMGDVASRAGMWNECFGCLFVKFLDIYNEFTETIATEGSVDPDTDFDSSVTVDGAALDVVSEASSLADYDRHVSITNDGAVCMNLHYSKDDTDSSKVKAIMHLDSGNCPGSETEVHAMAMKFDLKFTDANVQTATFFHTGDYDTDGFSVTGSDQDDIFYMNIEVDETDGSPVTTAWVMRLSQNSASKFYIQGEDDVQLFAAGPVGNLELSNADLDDSDLTSQCVDDSSDTNTADGTLDDCTVLGYGFNDFPFTVDSVADKEYPEWTADTLTVTADADVEDYF